MPELKPVRVPPSRSHIHSCPNLMHALFPVSEPSRQEHYECLADPGSLQASRATAVLPYLFCLRPVLTA